MTELADRLTRLADAAVADRRLADPSAVVAVDGRRSRPPWPWLGAAAVILVAVALAAVVVVGDDDDAGPVTAGPDSTATSEPASTGPTSTDATTEPAPTGDPVLSIAFQLVNGDAPLGLRVVVRDDEGATVAERTSAEVEEPLPDGSARVMIRRGIVVDLPGAGTYAVDLLGEGVALTCVVGTVGAGERVVLPIATDPGALACERPETEGAWGWHSTESGLPYVGLTEEDALAEATASGVLIGVGWRDGVGLPVAAGLSGLTLVVFDGVVVAAYGMGQEPVGEPPRVEVPLAVVLTTPTGEPLTEGGEVQVVVRREGVDRAWEPPTEGGSSVAILIEDLPAGPGTVQVIGWCEADIDVATAGTVVTVEVAPDGSVARGDCPVHVETLAEHVAQVAEDFDGYQPADGYLGLSEAEARARAEEEGREVRVLARDGLRFGRTDDLRPDRVNLVLYADEVRAAALF